MTLFDMTFLNIIFLIISLCFASIFQIYEKNFSDRKNYLYLDLALMTSFYLILKYGVYSFYDLTVLFLNIPILIAAVKGRDFSFLIMSIFIIFIYYMYHSNMISLLILEYIAYIFIYFFLNKKIKIKKSARLYFLVVFLVLKTLTTILYQHIGPDIQILLFAFYAVIGIVLYFLQKVEKFLQVSFSIKKLEEEKNVRMSLFKITHEIKNPIAVCNGYLQMFNVDNIEHSKKYIPIIRDEIDKVLNLLEDFLSITKIKIQSDIIDIYYLLEESLESIKPILKEKEISYRLNIPDEELYIEADYHRLNQVLINLMKNSIEAIGNNGNLEVTTKIAKKYLYIYVTDDGIGISKENLKRMQEPFFTTKKKGTGLGVFLSKEIIKAHHGDIYYHSNLNKGTTVEIKLPLKKDISYS